MNPIRKLLILLLLLALPLGEVLAARHALVVGNDSYRNVTPLKNARADARAMAKALEGAGFKVRLALDADRSAMNQALRQFKQSLAGGDEAIFFFAGHGVQLGGTNYLLPVDLQDAEEEQIKDDAVQLQRILEDLVEQKVRFSLAIIDACRDNPFKGAGRNLSGRGLAPTTAANGQMIIFSAGAGQKALDTIGPNDASQNGLFTRVFVREIEKSGVPIHDSLRNVREEVVQIAKGVGHDQVPAIYDQAIGKFYFRKGDSGVESPRVSATAAPAPVTVPPVALAAPTAVAVPTRQVDDQTALWEAVEKGNTIADYDAYLGQYPKGKFATLAKSRRDKLRQQEIQAAKAAEQEAWAQAERGATPESYEAYLAVYPAGSYATLAKTRAKKLSQDKRAIEEQMIWQSAERSGKPKEVQAYLDLYPKGRFVPLAKAKLVALASSRGGNDKSAEKAAAEARELEKKRLLERPIRTVAVLPVPLKPDVRFTSRTINPFSLVGKLVNKSERRTMGETLTKTVHEMNPSAGMAIQQSIERALANKGFTVRPSPLVKIDPESPSDVKYAKVGTDADALVHVYFSDIGVISSTFADAFVPLIEVRFCFVRPIEDQSCMLREDVLYGSSIKKDQKLELKSPEQYRWKTEEDLFAQLDLVKESLSTGGERIGKLIAEAIVAHQAKKN